MSNMRKIIWVIVVLIIIVGVFLIIERRPHLDMDNPIEIGAVIALTGPLSSYGVEFENGLRMAEEEINNNGGVSGRPIRLIIEDDGGDSKNAVSAASKLINVDGVKYLITAFSSPAQAVAPVAQENGVLNIGLTVSKLGNLGEYIFRDYWDMEKQGVTMGRVVLHESIDSIGIIALNWADYPEFKKGLDSVLGEDFSIIEERFNFGDSDFRTQLFKFKSNDVDAILVYGFPGTEVTNITEQIEQVGLTDKRLLSGATVYGFSIMYSELGDTLDKMKAIDTWYSLDESNPVTKRFIENYKKIYGTDLNGDAAYPYDVLYALVDAMKKSDNVNDIDEVSKNLLDVKIQGAAGSLSFDENGNSIRSSYLQQFIDGEWVPYSL